MGVGSRINADRSRANRTRYFASINAADAQFHDAISTAFEFPIRTCRAAFSRSAVRSVLARRTRTDRAPKPVGFRAAASGGNGLLVNRSVSGPRIVTRTRLTEQLMSAECAIESGLHCARWTRNGIGADLWVPVGVLPASMGCSSSQRPRQKRPGLQSPRLPQLHVGLL